MDNLADLDRVLDEFEQEADKLISHAGAVRKSDEQQVSISSTIATESTVGYLQNSALPSVPVFPQLPDLLGDGHSPMRDTDLPNTSFVKLQLNTSLHTNTNGGTYEAIRHNDHVPIASELSQEDVDAYLGLASQPQVAVSAAIQPSTIPTEHSVSSDVNLPSFPALPSSFAVSNINNQQPSLPLPALASPTPMQVPVPTPAVNGDQNSSTKLPVTQPIKRLGDFRPPKRPTTLLGLSKPVLPSDELRSANAIESHRSFTPLGGAIHAQTGPALPTASLAYEQTTFFPSSATVFNAPQPTAVAPAPAPLPTLLFEQINSAAPIIPGPPANIDPPIVTAAAPSFAPISAPTQVPQSPAPPNLGGPPPYEPPAFNTSETQPAAAAAAVATTTTTTIQAPEYVVPSNPRNVPEIAPANTDVPTGILIDFGSLETSAAPSASTNVSASGQQPTTTATTNTTEWQLGTVKPVWIPDSDAAVCMLCTARFTFTRRRHHCRACGKIFCAACCSQRSPLAYLNGRADRVCENCFKLLSTSDSTQRNRPASSSSVANTDSLPREQSSSVGGTEVTSPARSSPTHPSIRAMSASAVPGSSAGGAVDRPVRKRSEPKRVTFSDGVRPGTEEPDASGTSRTAAQVTESTPMIDQPSLPVQSRELVTQRSGSANAHPNSQSQSARRLPALASTEVRDSGEVVCKSIPFEDETELMHFLLAVAKSTSTQQATEPLRFALNSEVQVLLRFDSLNCCVQKLCWSFCSDGLRTFGEPELVVLLECNEAELRLLESDIAPSQSDANVLTSVLLDVLDLYSTALNEFAQTGRVHSELDVLLIDRPFLGSRQHGGWLLVKPTFQCIRNLPVPMSTDSFLVAVLINRAEVGWAKLFPLRLLLRFGAEFKYYPCPLQSIRDRSSVYRDVGHTVLSLFCDFQNFAYSLPRLPQASVQVENNRCTVRLPRSQHEAVQRLLDSCQDGEHVVALGASFNEAVDSHLVAVQNFEAGNYFTQAITVQNRQKKIAGASFVVFSGAYKQPDCTSLRVSSAEDAPLQRGNHTIEQLKQAENVQLVTSNGNARWSIVEDGVLVQFTADTFSTLRNCLKSAQSVLFVASGSPSPTDSNTPSPQDDSIAHSFAQSGSSLLAVHLANAHSVQTLAVVWFD